MPPGSPVPPASVASPGVPAVRTWPFALTAVVLVALVAGLFVGRLLAEGRGPSGGVPAVRVEGAPAAGEVPAAVADDAPAPVPDPASAPAAAGGAR